MPLAYPAISPPNIPIAQGLSYPLVKRATRTKHTYKRKPVDPASGSLSGEDEVDSLDQMVETKQGLQGLFPCDHSHHWNRIEKGI